MRFQLLLIFFLSSLASAKDASKCSLYSNMIKDLQTVEMEITSDQDCDINGKKQKCKLRDLQARYNSLQAQNVLLFGIANLINQFEKNLTNLANPSDVIEKNIQDLKKLQNGGIVYSAISDITHNNSKLKVLSKDDSQASIISKLKKEFCDDANVSSGEMCSILKTSLNSDGTIKNDVPTQAVLGYVTNYLKIEPVSDQDKANGLIKNKLNEKEKLFDAISKDDVDKLINEANNLNQQAKCLNEQKTKTQPQPAPMLNFVVVVPSPVLSPDVSTCLMGKNIDDFKKELASNVQSYNKKIASQVGQIQNKQNAEKDLFEYFASSTLMADEHKKSLLNDPACFSGNSGCEANFLRLALGDQAPLPSNDIDFEASLYGPNIIDSFQDFSNSSKFAQNLDQCNESDKKKCFLSELTKEMQKLCSGDKKKTLLTENDVLGDHAKVKACLADVKKDDLIEQINKNSNEILVLQTQMKGIYNKKTGQSSNPLYRDITYAKAKIFKKWDVECDSRLEAKNLSTLTCNADQSGSESQLRIFLDSNKKVISSLNKDVYREMNSKLTQDSTYKFDQNNFCDPTFKNLTFINELCQNGLASLSTSSNQTGGGTATTATNQENQSGNQSRSTERKQDYSEVTKKQKKSNESASSDRVRESTFDSTGEAIGSGLLSSLKYGIQTWQNFNQVKSYNQIMMNNAYVVRNAELNPPHLSFNPAPPMYQPAMYTGTPLGYLNPYSSTFNYNNNSFYYNTYDPTNGTTLSNDSSYSFSR